MQVLLSSGLPLLVLGAAPPPRAPARISPLPRATTARMGIRFRSLEIMRFPSWQERLKRVHRRDDQTQGFSQGEQPIRLLPPSQTEAARKTRHALSSF